MDERSINNSLGAELSSFKEDTVQMRNVDGLLRNVKQYLGTIDADKEWNDNPEEAYRKFLHTQSYCDFTDPNSLILLGRTGTGKTSILRCLCENVNKKKFDLYDSAIMVSFDDILSNLIETIDDFNNPVINRQLQKSISAYINCYVMKRLIKDGIADKSSAMYAYLKEHNLYDIDDVEYTQTGISKVRCLLETATKLNNKAGEMAENAVTVIDIVNAFMQKGYTEAYREMIRFLNEERRNVLVLIDTIDEYDLRDIKVVLCVKALISVCFQYYKNTAFAHLYLKISIPSEIHTHLFELLPEKQQGNTVVIQWKNNDLIKMIAMRMLYWSNKDESGLMQFHNIFEYSDFYDDNPQSTENAKKILHEFLPETCPTSLSYSFDTLAYIIRHTLKKPRELMSIFNAFIAMIYEKRNLKFFIENPNEIRNAIHSTQEGMISGALSMYSKSYPNILKVCEIVLEQKRYILQGKEFDSALKEAMANNLAYNIDDIKRILLESGLIGKISEISCLHPNSAGVGERIRLIKAKFEYQVKGKLSLNKNDYYVLHPMCYEHFQCEVGTSTLVYPDQFESESDITKSLRLKQ